MLPESVDEGVRVVEDVMEKRLFGEAGAVVVVEERLEGHEFSLLAFCDGERAVCMVSTAQCSNVSVSVCLSVVCC